MDFPIDAWHVVEQMHARFAADFPETEDGARGWTEKTIQQLKFSFPNGGWCWKSSTPTNPPSKDCAARQFEGRFEGWDMLAGAGANGPKNLAPYPPIYHDLIAEGNQNPIPVEAHDWLGVPPVDPDPELEDRVTELERQVKVLGMNDQTQAAQIALLRADLNALTARVEALEADGGDGEITAPASVPVTLLMFNETYTGTVTKG